MKPLKSDDIFSKTMYPIATYRDGETKNIICRIIGISDISDIETVTIWVTTFSNKPPKMPGSIDAVEDKDADKNKENLSEQNLRHTDLKFGHLQNKPASEANPDLKLRFNDYDNANDDDEFLTPKKSNAKEEIPAKDNPTLIEGTLPFLRSSANTDKTVSNSPFLSESGDAKDPLIGSPKEIIVQPKEFMSDESDEDTPITAKPSLLERLKKLRNKDVPTLIKSPETKSTSPSKGGFFQNLIKPNSGNTENKAATPVELSSVAEDMDSITNAVPSNPDTDLNKKTSELTQALQEVKVMVENMKKDAQKDSESRLLGSPQTEGSEKNPLESLMPQNFVENAKKVNEYFIDRAQDALDTINPKTIDKENNLNDISHSGIIPNGITGIKKMSQHLLDNLKNNQLVGANKPIQMEERFGETTEEIPIVTTYKNKLDQYLQERKKQVQKKYSPETKLRAAEDLKGKLKIPSVDLKKPLKNAGIMMTRMAEKANNLKTKPLSWLNDNKNYPEQLLGNTEDNSLESNDINGNYFLPTPTPSDQQNTETQNKFMKYLENLRSKTTEKPVDTKKDLLKDKLKDYVSSLRNQNKEKPQLDTKKISELMRKASENQKESVNGLKKKLEKILAENKVARSPSVGIFLEEPVIGKKLPADATNFQEPSTVSAINPNMENRDSLKINTDWSNQLGKIVQSSSKPQDIFFMGSGVKLPLKVKQSNDGSMDLSVDLEKLCSCYNATCTDKNQTALDETVGAILEQEAVLENQLKNSHEEVQLKRQKRMYDSPNLLENDSPNLLENHVQKQLEKSFKKSVNQLQNDVKKLNKKLVDSLNVALPTGEFGGIRNPTQDPSKAVNQLKENFRNIFPEVTKIQKQVAEAAGDVTKISEAYEKVKISNLENRLKKLDNEIEKLQDTNEEKVREETRKFLQGDQRKRIQEEANILSKVFSWVDSFSKKQ
ncbi:unnamed protein product [Ceutorhynchus assimilis]|uniref:Uncharacterized protein n=1 Tax=Ceutorhynchus assimilis TaxID=467358 RepID=A0A9P0DKZ6_9CUCU|nr:unnamed protein product [Ceutorhynchus assimilis]